ncbi:tetratricopeptide repeat protein [Rhodocytophaga aerolata]|uniref:histidine kinase n=2 Tax=Rhodocytophaga aerolata TaxID=455078 RepID=A0ABT8RDX5_9BACT|nr:tetratricopeptide repeat protein [Rhodocytophaga aerolata]MDO1449438.1 tetratricopeptide repeat protein [Rhodocytophaga aerolata]
MVVSLFVSDAYSQKPAGTIDSLQTLLKQLPQDTSRVKTLVELAWQFHGNQDTSRARATVEQALTLAQALGYEKGLALGEMFRGYYHNKANRYNQAVIHYQAAKKHFQRNGNQKGLANATSKTGISLLNNSSYALALEQFNQSISLYRVLQDSIQLANNLLNAGIAYQGMGDYTKALSSFFECLKLDESLGNQQGVASDYDQIAIIYKKQKQYTQAEAFEQKAIRLYRQIDDDYGLASSLNNLGILYKNMGKYTEAVTVLAEAEKLFMKISNNRGQVAVLSNLGEIYLMQKKYTVAMQHFTRSVELGQQIQWKESLLSNWEGLTKVYTAMSRPEEALQIAFKGLSLAESLSAREYIFKFHQLIAQAYKANKEYEKALSYLEKSVADNDSLYTAEQSRQLLELQTRYETEKKEQQIALLSKDSALQKSELSRKTMLQYILLAALIAFLVFAFLIFRIYRAKAKSKRLLLSEQLKTQQFEAQKLAELHAIKSRFFSNIAHEFRTPLTLILGPVESLMDRYSSSSREADLLKMVKNNASRLLLLINQLLDLSRIESGIIGLTMKQEDVVRFLKGLTYSFLSLAEQKNIALVFSSGVDSLPMDFDEDKLEKIMSNLLANAFKFTPEGGRVEVSVAQVSGSKGSFLQIAVADNGIGIPSDQVPFVFERFFQASNGKVRDIEGSGIGLSLTKELVEIHQGSIEVSSQPGQGTTFLVQLPVTTNAPLAAQPMPATQVWLHPHTQEQPFMAEAQSATDALMETGIEPPSEIILVIEDNEEVRRFIAHALWGCYQVVEAVNGIEGVQKANEIIPDLIISDVMMPEMDGYETCRLLKSEEKTSHIPVILLTAKAGLESKLEGLDTGADDYLSKPFNTQELKARIKNLIALRKKLQSRYLNQAVSSEPAAALPPIENIFITKLKEVVYANLSDESFSIEQLSSELAMSRTQVHRKLKALTNQSASQFIRIIRLQKAKELLLDGQHNVSEAAYLTGFNSSTYFSTCFTEYYGYPPSELKVK